MKFYFPHDDMYTPTWRLLDMMLTLTLPIDRSKIINNFGFDYVVNTPIPADTHTSLTFAEITDNNAEDIYKKRSNPVLLMWSGGIDSTTAIAAFINLGIDFTVGYTSSSEGEYPWLYKELMNNKWPQITMLNIGDTRVDELQKCYHLVTGLYADQLIGGVSMFVGGYGNYPYAVRPRLLEDYKTVMPAFLLDFFQDSIDAFPGEVVDFCDFLWWMNFNLKYQSMHHTQITYMHSDTTNPDTYSHFYEGDEFQRWAMSNRALNKEFAVKDDVSLYKIESRRYMFDVFRDQDYIDNKCKVSSAAAHYGEVIRETGPTVIDKDGEMQLFWKEK